LTPALGYAKRLLLDRRHSIVEIALDAGFSEQSHFTRAFGPRRAHRQALGGKADSIDFSSEFQITPFFFNAIDRLLAIAE